LRRLLLAILVAVPAGSDANEPVSPLRPAEPAANASRAARPAVLFPDYAGVVIPPNIAPLNFVVREPGRDYRVAVRGARGEPITIRSRDGTIRIPSRSWSALLQANLGQEWYVEISVRGDQGAWVAHPVVTNRVAPEPIDPYLAYRLIRPLHNFFRDMGIYQRNLATFEQHVVVHNRSFDRGCVNCHTFNQNSPATLALNIRSPQHGRPLLLVKTNTVWNIEQTAGYLSWHPSGERMTFSQNKLALFFHTTGETRDVFDAKSDLALYDLRMNRVLMPPAIADPDRLETWPEWDPPGRYLYFSSAPLRPFEQHRLVQYDLMRVAYDPESDRWGTAEVVLTAAATGLSITQPKVSPNGRFLVFTMAPYGHFPIYQPESDLYLMDLTTRQYHRLESNSDAADSWHCWSSNSRWLVFSSKRLAQVFARPHFTYVDDAGRASKPFVLPQQDPAFYDSFPKTYNVPQFIAGPVTVSPAAIAEAITKPRHARKPAAATKP
jgi:hypothetical protein